MHQRQDERLRDVAESQTKLRDAIDENARLIRENERLIDRYKRIWLGQASSIR